MPAAPVKSDENNGTLADLLLQACRDPTRYWAHGMELSDHAVAYAAERGYSSPQARKKARRVTERMLLENTAAERARLEGTLRTAKRFVLQKSFVRTVVDAVTRGNAETAASMVRLARLPFPKVFVEFSPGDVASASVDRREIPDKMGFLLERVRPEDPTQWCATMYWSFGNRLRDGATSVTVSTDGEPAGTHPAYPHLDAAAIGLGEDIHHRPFDNLDRTTGRWLAPEGYEDAVRIGLTGLAPQHSERPGPRNAE